MRVRFSLVLFPVLLPLLAFASEPFAKMVTSGATIEWQSLAEHAALVLSVQHANGEVSTETFASGRVPTLRIEELGGDGTFTYELRLVPRVSPKVKAKLAAAREAGDENEVTRIQHEAGLDREIVQSGSFTVLNGAILSPAAEEPAGGRTPETEWWIADDVAATGGLCGGSDCTDTESYGFVTLKLKDNYTRIKFEDTSTSVGFPTSDWQLSTNDTSSGGAEKFFLEDLTAATVPVLVESGAPTNAFYVDSTGRIGFRTSTPAKDLHISTGSWPTIRLEQNTSGGFAAHSWELTANEQIFSIRDASLAQSGLTVRAGAPGSSFVVGTNGYIGLGVFTPSYPIHHSSGARLEGGNWTNASSREIKQDIHRLDPRAAFDALDSLDPVTYAYKSNPDDKQVGFIAEDVPELVATPDHKGLSAMDIAALLTKVVKEQQKTIEEMRARLACLEEKE